MLEWHKFFGTGKKQIKRNVMSRIKDYYHEEITDGMLKEYGLSESEYWNIMKKNKDDLCWMDDCLE